jgi:hypothetical protein
MIIRLQKNGTSWLKLNGFTKEEEQICYEEQLKDIFNNPREYLDNLEYLPEYRVYWKNYNYKTATIPYKFINKTQTTI